jgi:enoyl-CoA hydratase/carnithine racemase
VPRLLRQDRGTVRVLTLDNAEKRNALDPDLLKELVSACVAAGGDGVRCLVLRGAGDRAFSAGFDLQALERAGSGAELPDASVEQAMAAVEEVPCPTIAFLNGPAFGAGCELAVACDLRVAREGISMGMPPAKLGVIYAPAGLARFERTIGLAHTRELFFTGRPVDARRALEMGLVDRVVAADRAEVEALGLAAEIAANAPLAVQGTKRILALLGAGGLDAGEAQGVELLRRAAFASEDAREGRLAFQEKRPPLFRGR